MERTMTFAEEQATADAERRWEADAALRAEFCDDKAACMAYFRAVARGADKVFRGAVTHVKGGSRE